MCGRFNVSADPLAELLMALVGQGLFGADNTNVAPTRKVEIIRPNATTGELELLPMRWWLTPFWATEISTRYSMFNARSETLEKSRAYREPFKQRRCVVPVGGFYEWVRQGRSKLPYYIRPRDDCGMLLAAVWDSWRDREDPTAGPLLSFSVVTTAVHCSLKFVHNRQPVMLDGKLARLWMDRETPLEILYQLMLPALPQDTLAIPVSSYVNNTRHTGKRCIEPIGDAVALPAKPVITRLSNFTLDFYDSPEQ